jgi:hypothetical protein
VVIDQRRIDHTGVAARRIDRKSDVLGRGADSGVDHVEKVAGVADTEASSVSLLERAARRARGLHADDLWLGVDMVDEGKPVTGI